MLTRLVKTAKEQGLQSCVMTFEPHPIEILKPAMAPTRISNLRDKLSAIAACGVDYVYVQHFNSSFSGMSAQAFEETFLHQSLKTRHILIGDDFRYGAGRQGDFQSLVNAGQRLGFTVASLPTITHDEERVSSSAIRQALKAGDLAHAQSLMGRPYMISGHVLHGQKLGRNLGFPTLNLAVANRLHVRKPAIEGIFVALVHGLRENPLSAVASLGQRPTVDDSGRYLLEVHIFDFQEEVYGKLVQVELLEKIRDEARYEDLTQLQTAIASDAVYAKNYFDKLKK